jgi:hydroxymethylglutaryl-CoA lyase
MDAKIIECPRDAMQGIKEFIETKTKVSYLNKLLKCGFDTLDFGSFVSPKAIPQLADTAEVLSRLDLNGTRTKLLSIVANTKGAEIACSFPEIKYLGFPFSLSETFQQRNTNSSMADALETVKSIQDLCGKHQKELVVYLSMGFGNPYGDPWDTSVVAEWTEKFSSLNVKILSLSDTIGIASPADISYLYKYLIPNYPQIEFGAHLHTTPHTWREKVDAAWTNGCKRFDGAIKGFGGCPMAADDLTGNMPTEKMLSYFDEKNIKTGVNIFEFNNAMEEASLVFGAHA